MLRNTGPENAHLIMAETTKGSSATRQTCEVHRAILAIYFVTMLAPPIKGDQFSIVDPGTFFEQRCRLHHSQCVAVPESSKVST
jgi:hypothetical protein